MRHFFVQGKSIVNLPPQGDPDMEKASVYILVSGIVQGVGFRFFARRMAERYSLSGYVKNRDDGRVEIVAEGNRDDLEHFIAEMWRGPAYAEVSDVDVSWGNYEGKYNGFSIRFY